MDEMIKNALDTSAVHAILDEAVPLYLVLTILLFWVARRIHDFFTPYDLDEQLTGKDNKAVALSFAGLLAGVGVIIHAVMTSGAGKDDLWRDLGDTAGWAILGIVLLQIARKVNSHLIIGRFSNIRELVDDRNAGVGMVEAGSFIGSAFIIGAVLGGESLGDPKLDAAAVTVYFVAGQAAFVIFGRIYQMITDYDVHKTLEDNNVATGTAFGLQLAAMGLLLGDWIGKYDSLPGLAAWFVVSIIVLVAVRALVDRAVLPKSKLDEEISRDANWGAALIEGLSALVVAFVFGSLF